MKLRIPYTGVVIRSLMPNLIQAGGNGLGISKKTDVPDI